jgi:adenine deaminase
VEVRGAKGYVVMPGFSDFVVVYENGSFLSVLKKEWVREKVLYKAGKISKREMRKILKGDG